MDIKPCLLLGHVTHKRLFPKVNSFTYGIYYLASGLRSLAGMPMAINRFGPTSFYHKDHGARSGDDLQAWIAPILSENGISVQDIILVAMPRIFGYVFNPVSFWFCFDDQHDLRAVVCEVNNTFGENHSYLCVHDDHRPISGDDWLYADKLFHVSPFLERTGHYRFRFNIKDDALGVWIDYYAADGRLQLMTALTGKFQPMTKSSLRSVLWGYPLITFRAIFLIHWQALKLFAKGIKYVPKPLQNKTKLSRTHKITKM